MNQILEIGLHAYVTPSLDDWSQYLGSFALAYNTSIHSTTGFSPAYLLRGFKPIKASDLHMHTAATIKQPAVKSDKANKFDQGLITLHKQVHDTLKLSQAVQQKYYNA